MQMNTLIIFGFLAIILMLSSCEGSKLFLDDDNDMELTEAKARMFLEAESEADDFDRRAAADNCVNCKFGIFKCCHPHICVKKFLRPDECMEIKTGK